MEDSQNHLPHQSNDLSAQHAQKNFIELNHRIGESYNQ